MFERNLKSKIESETALIKSKLDLANQENARLKEEVESNNNYFLYIILVIIGIVIGYLLTK